MDMPLMVRVGTELALCSLLTILCSCSKSAEREQSRATAPALSPTATEELRIEKETESIRAGFMKRSASAVRTKPTAALHTTVTDAKTHVGVSGAGVVLRSTLHEFPDWIGWTDANGRLDATVSIPAKGIAVIDCPARRTVNGKELKRIKYAVALPETSINIDVDTDECIEPPFKSTNGVLAGYYLEGPEQQIFAPCDGSSFPIASYYGALSAWVEFGHLDEPSEKKLRELISAASTPENELFSSIYVEWLGNMEGPAQYGHMGANPYQFTVRHLLKAALSAPASCPPPAWFKMMHIHPMAAPS